MQFDADTVGSASPAADAELCMMAADTMEKLGIPRGSYIVKVNNRKVLDGLLEELGLTGDENAKKRLTVMRAVDKLDRLGADAVRLLLTKGRLDESGAFAPGAGLSDEDAARVMALFDARTADNEETCTLLSGGDSAPALRRQGADELREVARLIKDAGYADRVTIDPSVVRGLEYYTGFVFEVELTFEVKGEDGAPVRFGSVAGGGRYDGLIARFRDEPVPATGFSIGVSRLYAALTALGKVTNEKEAGPVVVTVFDKSRLSDYQAMASRLREAGIRAEVYLGSSGIKAQMKYADRRNAPCVILQGSDEKTRSEVQIKDLVAGAEAAASNAFSNKEWKELRPGQFAVPEDQLVDAVREIIKRQLS
jgi:histidyl-tRNA synthetase